MRTEPQETSRSGRHVSTVGGRCRNKSAQTGRQLSTKLDQCWGGSLPRNVFNARICTEHLGILKFEQPRLNESLTKNKMLGEKMLVL